MDIRKNELNLGSEFYESKPNILGNLTMDSNWLESTGRPLEKDERQFFHSTFAYNMSPEHYRQLDDDEFILDRRMFADEMPQVGYGLTQNPQARKFPQNPDQLVLIRIITGDVEPFKKIQQEGLDLSDLEKGGFTGGPEPRFDPKYLGYNLRLKKIGEEKLENYNFPHRVITYKLVEKIPLKK